MVTRAMKREISNAAYRTFWWAWFGLIAVALVTGWHWPRPITLAVPMAGYGLPVCATEDSTPPGGCVWRTADAVLINYPGRT